jgi:hypothetical protein
MVQDSTVKDGEERVAAVYRDHHKRMWRALFSFAGDPISRATRWPRRSLVRSEINTRSVTLPRGPGVSRSGSQPVPSTGRDRD